MRTLAVQQCLPQVGLQSATCSILRVVGGVICQSARLVQATSALILQSSPSQNYIGVRVKWVCAYTHMLAMRVMSLQRRATLRCATLRCTTSVTRAITLYV